MNERLVRGAWVAVPHNVSVWVVVLPNFLAWVEVPTWEVGLYVIQLLLDDEDLEPLLPLLPELEELPHQSPLLLDEDDLDPDLPLFPLDDDELDDPHLDGGLPHPPPL